MRLSAGLGLEQPKQQQQQQVEASEDNKQSKGAQTMSSEHSPEMVRYGEGCEYMVNNSFHCGLQPKRASNDVHLYMLLHKKILRKAVIDKRFEDNLQSFFSPSSPNKPGFKGKTTRVHHSLSKHLSLAKQHSPTKQHNQQFRVKTRATTCQFQLQDHSKNRLIEQRRVWVGNQNASSRPNMMYNLTLYRRSFRKNEVKYNSNCLRVAQQYKQLVNLTSDYEDNERQRRVRTLM